MPMYYPDLDSVQRGCEMFAKSKNGKPYKGLIPQTEADLPEARKQFAKYMREELGDIVWAAEIEFAATPENYDNVVGMGCILRALQGSKK